MDIPRSRRTVLGDVARLGAMLAVSRPFADILGIASSDERSHRARFAPLVDPDHERLAAWSATLRTERLADAKVPLGRGSARVGELALGTPYEAYTLEAYIKAG